MFGMPGRRESLPSPGPARMHLGRGKLGLGTGSVVLSGRGVAQTADTLALQKVAWALAAARDLTR